MTKKIFKSIVIVAAAVLLASFVIILGCIYGGISGYFGGTLDIIMMRLLEIINGIPYLIIVILLIDNKDCDCGRMDNDCGCGCGC